MARVVLAASAVFVVLFAIVCPSVASPRTGDNEAEKSTSANSDNSIKASPAVRLSKDEVRLVKAVNAYRAKRDLEPLAVDPTLMKVARDAAPYYSHCINGKWCWNRAHEAGFCGWATDDIAKGYESPEDAVDGWATSDGHAHQMRGDFNMNGQWRNYHFNRIGVGISGRKYIAVFGRYDEKQSGGTKSEAN